MKEAFIWQGKKRDRYELCPSCLDRVMAEGRLSGIVGQKKKAAIQLTPWVAADAAHERMPGSARRAFGTSHQMRA